MSLEEKRYYYFNQHDRIKDNVIDGIEIIDVFFDN